MYCAFLIVSVRFIEVPSPKKIGAEDIGCDAVRRSGGFQLPSWPFFDSGYRADDPPSLRQRGGGTWRTMSC